MKRDYFIEKGFDGDYAIARILENKDSYIGIIDKNMNVIEPFLKFDEKYSLREGHELLKTNFKNKACITSYKDTVYEFISNGIYINHYSKTLININNREKTFNNEISVIQYNHNLNMLVIQSKYGYGLGSINGEIIVEPIYNDKFEKFDDYIKISTTNNGDIVYGLTDLNGNLIINTMFTDFVKVFKQKYTYITAIMTEKNSNKKKTLRAAIIKLSGNTTVSISFLPIKSYIEESKLQATFLKNVVIENDYVIFSNNSLPNKEITSSSKFGVSDIYGNIIIPCIHDNPIETLIVNNKTYFKVYRKESNKNIYALLDINDTLLTKYEWSDLIVKDDILYGIKEDIYFKISLENREYYKTNIHIKSDTNSTDYNIKQNSNNISSQQDKENKLIVDNYTIEIEYFNNKVILKNATLKKEYTLFVETCKIELIRIGNKNYILCNGRAKTDDCSIAILDYKLEGKLKHSFYGFSINFKNNLLNTNCFELEEVFPSIASSYFGFNIHYIYDEDFNFLGEFKDYKCMNLYEIFFYENGKEYSLNLLTKEKTILNNNNTNPSDEGYENY